MRRIMSGVGLLVCGAVAACTVFSGDDSHSPPSSRDAVDAGTSLDGSTESGVPPVADDGIAIHVDAAEVRVVQGKSVQIPVTLVRGKDAQGPVVVTVSGLRSGLSAKPLTIEGTDGMLEVTATVDVAQGPANATLDGAFADKHVSLPLNLFVRGPSGSLDTTFANQGIYQESAAGSAALDIAADPSGALMAFYRCPIGVCIHRLSADGVMDTIYGDKGTGSIGIKTVFTPFSDAVPAVNAVRTSDGGWIIGSEGGLTLNAAHFVNGAIGRVGPNGIADSAFGTGASGPGTMASSFEYGFGGLVLNDKDEIFAVGATSEDPKTHQDNIAVEHYSKFGVKDASFGTVTTTLKPSTRQEERFTGIGITQSGSVLVFGIALSGNVANPTMHVYYGVNALLGQSGALDPNFGAGGHSYVDLDGSNLRPSRLTMRWLTTAPNQKRAEVVVSQDPNQYWLVVFSENGLPSASFGDASGRTGPFLLGDYWPTSLASTSDGKLVVVLSVQNSSLSHDNLPAKLVRHDSMGNIDKSFGKDGFSEIPANVNSPDILIQPDGRIVIAMTRTSASSLDSDQLVLMRYWD